MAGFNEAPLIQRIAIPAVSLLILFLGYSSQLLFFLAADLAPGPLTRRQATFFNILLASLWWTYYRACTVSPGLYVFPSGSSEPVVDSKRSADAPSSEATPLVPKKDDAWTTPTRWCKKCDAPKPPRAHHCKHCKRCIPKMDHHCPWTANCVSMTTFPHFLRFLVYTNISLWMLGYLLFLRFYALWEERDLPAYLGPNLASLIHLTLLSLGCFFTSLALGILLATTLKNWFFNTTTIEGWEIERHDALVSNRRGGRGDEDWWAVMGPDGKKMRVQRVEFPYDLGIFANMAQAMGSSNPLLWFFPFASGPQLSTKGSGAGFDWEENGFNDKEGMWPPLDPEKVRRAARSVSGGWLGRNAEEYAVRYSSREEELAAFKARQAKDMERWNGAQRGDILAELEEVDDYDMIDEAYGGPRGAQVERESDRGSEGSSEDDTEEEEGPRAGRTWMNSDGERLADYGVDEEVDDGDVPASIMRPVPSYDDDDVPLGELLRRRRVVELPDDYDG